MRDSFIFYIPVLSLITTSAKLGEKRLASLKQVFSLFPIRHEFQNPLEATGRKTQKQKLALYDVDPKRSW